MEASLGLSRGKLTAAWSSLSGGEGCYSGDITTIVIVRNVDCHDSNTDLRRELEKMIVITMMMLI